MSAIFLIPGCTVNRPRGILKIYSALWLILTVSHSDKRSIVRVPRQLNLASPISYCMFCDFHFFFFFTIFRAVIPGVPLEYVFTHVSITDSQSIRQPLCISSSRQCCAFYCFALLILLPPGWTAELLFRDISRRTSQPIRAFSPSVWHNKITHVYDLRIKL